MTCCYNLKELLKNDNFHISCHIITRRYYVRVIGSGSLQLLQFCFFCGKKFPQNLYETWKTTIKKELNIDDPWDALYKETLPEEFVTDQWWKKRGL